MPLPISRKPLSMQWSNYFIYGRNNISTIHLAYFNFGFYSFFHVLAFGHSWVELSPSNQPVENNITTFEVLTVLEDPFSCNLKSRAQRSEHEIMYLTISEIKSVREWQITCNSLYFTLYEWFCCKCTVLSFTCKPSTCLYVLRW